MTAEIIILAEHRHRRRSRAPSPIVLQAELLLDTYAFGASLALGIAAACFAPFLILGRRL